MKDKYIDPAVEFVFFNVEDIVASSPDPIVMPPMPVPTQAVESDD